MAKSLIPVSVAIDTKSPLYLHPSDHPSLVLVTQTLRENGENYYTWRRTFLNALQAKNKAGFLDGPIVRPDDDSPDLQAWIQCNALVLAWLSNALGKDHQDGTAHVETACEAWMNLEEQFTQGIAPRIYELRRAIVLLQQEKAPISAYYGKLKSLWNELQASCPIPTCTCGAAKKMADIREEEKVFYFLMGLDDIFSTVCSQILALDPFPNLGKVYAIAAQDEKQALVAASRVPQVEGAVLAAGRINLGRGVLALGGKPAIKSLELDSDGIPSCTYCHKPYHTRENYYQLIGYPSTWKRGAQRKSGKNCGADRHEHRQLQTPAPAAFNAMRNADTNVLQTAIQTQLPALTVTQQQQILAALNPQQHLGNSSTSSNAHFTQNSSGLTLEEAYWSG